MSLVLYDIVSLNNLSIREHENSDQTQKSLYHYLSAALIENK